MPKQRHAILLPHNFWPMHTVLSANQRPSAMQKTIAAIAICLMVSTSVLGQGKIGAFLGVGTTIYQGDLKETIFPNPATLRWTVDAGIHWQINRRWGLQLNYTLSELCGSDEFASSVGKQKRNLKFSSINHEISLRGTYDILRNDRWKFLPYITAGVGALNFDPKRDGVALRPLATEGVAYSPWTVAFPTGLGLKYQINCNWNLKAEAVYHWTLTDYLDDVSGAYPAAENQVPFYTDPGNVSPPRTMRGDPAFNDGYWDVNIGVIYYFWGCKRRNSIEDCNELYKNLTPEMRKQMEPGFN